jgi:LytS/YehU family sensor histidine kinase
VASAIFSSPYAIKNLFYIVFQALGVYFNLYFLVPRLLEKGKYIPYVILVVMTILLTAALIAPGYYISASLSGQEYEQLYGVSAADYFHFFKLNTLPSSVASMTLAMSVKLAKKWLESKRREELLQKQKLESELQFLKYQLNPHFLFNTMNSIFFLIRKDQELASAALAKFSDMLRHQLYQSTDQHIPLRNEISYIHNFVSLEKLRQNDNMQVTVNFTDVNDDIFIAPFILMTFVENAFKHVSRDHDRRNFIDMTLTMQGTDLHFAIANSRSHVKLSGITVGEGGIGLNNVRRRLALLYPDKHKLEITEAKMEFVVHLKLTVPSCLKSDVGLQHNLVTSHD